MVMKMFMFTVSPCASSPVAYDENEGMRLISGILPATAQLWMFAASPSTPHQNEGAVVGENRAYASV
jgi:hypothetical protein